MERTLLEEGLEGLVALGFQGVTRPVVASMAARLFREKVVPSVSVTWVKAPAR
jgi:hypothetical protein